MTRPKGGMITMTDIDAAAYDARWRDRTAGTLRLRSAAEIDAALSSPPHTCALGPLCGYADQGEGCGHGSCAALLADPPCTGCLTEAWADADRVPGPEVYGQAGAAVALARDLAVMSA